MKRIEVYKSQIWKSGLLYDFIMACDNKRRLRNIISKDNVSLISKNGIKLVKITKDAVERRIALETPFIPFIKLSDNDEQTYDYKPVKRSAAGIEEEW